MGDQSLEQCSTPNLPTLEYAKRPHLAWISRHRGKLILFALLLATAIPIWRYWQPLKHRVLWLYWFHQAMAHQMPAKAIDLIIEDPVKAAAAVSSNPDYQISSFMVQVANYVPAAYRELIRYDARLTLSQVTGLEGQAVAFMGTLKRPDGTPRFVVVNGFGGITGNLLQSVRVLVLPLPAWSDSLPPLAVTPPAHGIFINGPPPTATRLHSGVIDTTNTSHIEFEFEAGPRGEALRVITGKPRSPWTVSATGIIDAHLHNDDSITFSLRSFTGNDLNIRVGTANMTGDVQTLQAEGESRRGRVSAGPSRSTTRPAIRGR